MFADPVFPQDHTGINLAKAMEAALSLWDLDTANQICLPTDNGSNSVNAARILDSCFGNNLHLSVKPSKIIVIVVRHLEYAGKL